MTDEERNAIQEQKKAYQERKWKIDAYINKYRKEHSHPLLCVDLNPFVLHNHIAECLVLRIARYFLLEWNPYDVTDPCNSIEEKREEYCRQAADDMHYYRKMPRYAIEYAVFVGINGRKDSDGLFGQTDGKDKYSYVMPDELWETVKKIIKWEGDDAEYCHIRAFAQRNPDACSPPDGVIRELFDGEEPRPMPESDEVKRFHDRIKRKQLYTRK